jgi:signal transduction histidine kinase
MARRSPHDRLPLPSDQRQRALVEAQQQMAATVGATLDLPKVAARVLDVTVKYLPCDTATLFLRYGDEMRVCAVHNLPAELIGVDLNLSGPLLDELMEARAPVWLDDVQTDSRFIYTPHSGHIRGWLAAPLVIGERVIGQISLDSTQVGRFAADDAAFLSGLARQAAMALENAQLYGEATRRLQQMAILNEIFSAALSAQDFDEIVRRLLFAMKRSLGYEIIDVFMINQTANGAVMRLAAAGGTGRLIKWGEGIAGRTAAQGRPLLVEDLGESAEYEALTPDMRSALSVPIRIGERVIGVIEAQSRRPAAFGDADVHLLSIVAGQLAGALENARLYTAERRRTEEMLALLDVAETVSSSLNLPAMLNAAARRTIQVCRVNVCLIFLLTNEGRHFRLASRAATVETSTLADWQMLSALLQANTLDKFPRTFQTLTLGQPRIIDVEEEAGPLTQFLISSIHLRRMLFVPLRISDRSLGMMVLGNYDPKAGLDEQQVRLAGAIGRQLAVAVENAHLYERSRQNVRELSASLDQLRQTQAQLIQSAKLAAVGQLAAGVAHEINNPLTTVAGFSELVLRDMPPENERVRGDLALILREAQRARNVVRRLLDFARQSEPFSAPANLNEVVMETIALMRHSAANQGAFIVEEYDPRLPWARLDVNQFKQVVINLISNAMQAMPRGGNLTVSTGVETRDGIPGVWLKVSDTGVGIAPENLERIFEPFFTTKPQGEGTGLGLAVSYGIIKEHNGRIEVASTVGKGTTFTVWVPSADEKK